MPKENKLTRKSKHPDMSCSFLGMTLIADNIDTIQVHKKHAKRMIIDAN
jgi:hypothetical protein